MWKTGACIAVALGCYGCSPDTTSAPDLGSTATIPESWQGRWTRDLVRCEDVDKNVGDFIMSATTFENEDGRGVVQYTQVAKDELVVVVKRDTQSLPQLRAYDLVMYPSGELIVDTRNPQGRGLQRCPNS